MGWALRFWNSSVGKKAVMAITGLVGLGFVLGHMLGNLQVYLGREQLNGYAEALHHNLPLLWGTRVVVLLAVLLHLVAAVELQGMKNAARPVGYKKPGNIQATAQSRTMILSGVILLAFIAFHLMHLTLGNAHPSFIPLDAYGNLVRGFSVWWVSAFYIVAMGLLGMHLSHGAFSMFFSVGLIHPKYKNATRAVTYGLMLLVVLGNISIPVAVLTGVVK